MDLDLDIRESSRAHLQDVWLAGGHVESSAMR